MLYTEEAVRAGLRVRDRAARVLPAGGQPPDPGGARLAPAGGRDGRAAMPKRPVRLPHAGRRSICRKAGAHDPPARQYSRAEDAPTHRLPRRHRHAGGRAAAVRAGGGRPAAPDALRHAGLRPQPHPRRRAGRAGADRPLSRAGCDGLREHSHHPEREEGQPHFLPAPEDPPILLRLNRLRTAVRQTELLACHAFSRPDGTLARPDIVKALNRLSSLCWILMIRVKRGGQV